MSTDELLLAGLVVALVACLIFTGGYLVGRCESSERYAWLLRRLDAIGSCGSEDD